MLGVTTGRPRQTASIALAARLVFVMLSLLMTVSCSRGSPVESTPAGSLKVITHTNYSSGNEARISGSLAVDGAGCVTLQGPGGETLYPAFPRASVTTAPDSVVFDGRAYGLGEELVLAGGGSADDAEGLSVPPGCPSHGLTFISAPS